MRFLHLADLHIGKLVNEVNMLADQKYMLHQVLEYIESHQVDALVLAGDIYDKAVPSEEAVAVVDGFLSSLAELKCPTLIISGNHDSDERLDYGKRFFASQGIYIAGVYRGQVEKVVLQDEQGAVNFYLLPYIKASYVKHYYPERAEEIGDYTDALRIALEQVELNPQERNVLVAHQSVRFGDRLPELGGSETIMGSVGNVEYVDSGVFAGFDYTALGHFHSSQAVGDAHNIRYAGSILMYSAREMNRPKEFPLVELGAKGELNIEKIAFAPLHQMRRLEGRLADLIKPENVARPEDYVYVTLTDEVPTDNAMALLKSVYPNAMHLEYGIMNSYSGVTDGADEMLEKSFHELLEDFYRQAWQEDMGQEDWQLIEEAAREAGILE